MKAEPDRTIRLMLNRCKFLGVNILDLEDGTVGNLSYEVLGLSGFMNPVNIIATPSWMDGKAYVFPTIKSGITQNSISKLGKKYKEIIKEKYNDKKNY